MKYSQYPYKRIDLETFQKEAEIITTNFKSAKSAKKQIQIIQDYQRIRKEIDTYAQIANLNFARNTKDEKAKEENIFYDKIIPEIAAIDNKFTKAISKSKFKKSLLNRFGKHYFNLIDMELKSFDARIVDLLKKENELINRYNTLKASAAINFNGNIVNLTGLVPFKQDLNRDVRKKAFKASNDFFTK